MSSTVTGGAAAIAALEAAGVEVVFGIPGVHTLAFYDALQRSSIRHILARHEQGAGFMADGYARATGKPGVAIIITGPGITNVSTPVGEAYADSSPVVVISSQLERPHAGRMRGNLHDIRDQSGLMSVLTKRSTSVASFDQVAGAVYDAVTGSVAGRPRPMHVEVPLDLLSEQGELDGPLPHSAYRSAPTRDKVSKAAELLAGAGKPLIFAGGGAQDAGPSLGELAELLGAPVFTSIMGKGALSDAHPYALGHAWDPWGSDNPADRLLREADVALVVGSKLGAQDTNYWQMPLPPVVIRIDIDPDEVGLNYGPPTLPIVADARATLEALVEQLRQRGDVAGAATSVAEVDRYRAALRAKAERGDNFAYISALRSALPNDGIIAQDMTMMSYRMNDCFPVFRPRSYLFPSSYGTLGFSVPAAIGAKVGRPDAPVVAVVGDGGYQFTMQELATAMQFKLGVPIVIFNDSTYSAVKDAMQSSFEGVAHAVELVNPDFVKLADAYGIPGLRAGDPAALERAVREALTRDVPTIIDVPIAPA
jgi:acetolactate synthase-1/2/3 large subunit